MKLSNHFTLAEFTASQTAVRNGIENVPSAEVLANLRRLAATLEQIRALAGGAISVSSGYRCEALNRMVGGSANSAHVLGLAADITAPAMSPRALALLIRESGIEVDQLIYEGAWVHVGLSVGAPRGQVLTAKFTSGKAAYTEGIA